MIGAFDFTSAPARLFDFQNFCMTRERGLFGQGRLTYSDKESPQVKVRPEEIRSSGSDAPGWLTEMTDA